MKKQPFFLFIIFFLLLSCSAFSQESRINQLFNFGWKFQAGDSQTAQNVDFDDSQWRTLDLPHDFQFDQPWDSTASPARGFKAMSVGWYRKSFNADNRWKGNKVLLDFEGIMLTGDVWLNGRKIGGTDYGYLGFEADISDIIRYDSLNVVAVRASTGKDGNSRWYTGGGLFRDVHLVVKNPTSISRHGIYITTPEISKTKASVQVQVEMEGSRWKENELKITVAIFSPKGEQVNETKIFAPKKSKKQTDEILLPLMDVTTPMLWDCDNPNLYTAKITISLNGTEIDNVSEKFGIRSIEFSKEFGFKLNGKKLFLKGIANHHDLGAVGVAAYETSIARQMDKLKDFGYNCIRTSHNPYSESFLRLADEKGLLIVDELYDKWSNKDYWAGRVPWTEIVFQNIPEWIKRDRNHPSVVLWSLGNELQMREDLCGFQTGDWGVTTYRMLDVLVKRYDATRKTTVAMFPSRAGGIGKTDSSFYTNIVPPELATVTEVSSFNYRWMNYQDYLKHAPNMNIFQSEATTNELAAPYFGMDRQKMIGLAYWGAIAYWGESHGWPQKGWNYSFFDHDLNPFPQAYLIKSIFSDDPIVHIGVVEKASEKMEWNDQTIGTMNVSENWNRKAGEKYNIYTFTNAEDVELLVNGKSLGVKKNDTTDITKRNIILWSDVPYSDGEVVAVAKNKGKEVARHKIETTGKAVALKLVPENLIWKANGMDLQYVKVYAVDSKGRIVPTADSEVLFDVSGVATLIAVDNGDHESDELFAGNKRKLHNGFALAILRSSQTKGEAKIKASAAGLKSMEKKFLVN